MNKILENKQFKEQFIDWVNDYKEHFDHYPGTFCAIVDDKETVFSETEIWEAIEILYL